MQEMQETGVQSLGWEDPLKEDMVTHSSIIAREIPWAGEPGGLQPIGSQSQTRLKQLSMRARTVLILVPQLVPFLQLQAPYYGNRI